MIKQADYAAVGVLAELAVQLWDDHSQSELEQEYEHLITDPDAACFLEYVGDNPVGFAQCQLRHDYVEGTHSSPVGYLEGIFVVEEYRHKGYARELVAACEKWAMNKKCSEFASDCEIDNETSLSFHIATGFKEAGKIICFNKLLK